MRRYSVIGADQTEYGPVTEEQIRQWIAEGRVNAQTQTRLEGSEQYQPLGTFPEFAEALGTAVVAPGAIFQSSGAGSSAEEIKARDYRLSLGFCLERSWGLLKANFWPVVGISFVVLLVLGVVNQLISLLSRPAMNDLIVHHHVTLPGILIIALTSILGAPVYTVFMAGLFKYYLKLIRGQAAGFGDAFSGFGPALGQLVLLGVVQGLLTTAAFLCCILPGIYLAVCWYFATPLVVDRELRFWHAMELSRKVVTKHWFVVFGCGFVFGLLAMCGIIACCIGIFATMPLGLMALMYAYEDMFGNRPAA